MLFPQSLIQVLCISKRHQKKFGLSVGLLRKLLCEVGLGPFVATAGIHLHKHAHQATGNHFFQALGIYVTEHTY